MKSSKLKLYTINIFCVFYSVEMTEFMVLKMPFGCKALFRVINHFTAYVMRHSVSMLLWFELLVYTHTRELPCDDCTISHLTLCCQVPPTYAVVELASGLFRTFVL